MPHRVYQHTCCLKPKITGSKTCDQCGQEGKLRPGWERSVVEHMCRYASVTGLIPFGAHRNHDAGVWACFRRCDGCDAIGIVDSDRGGWVLCSACAGSGYQLVSTQDELLHAVEAVLALCPGAQ